MESARSDSPWSRGAMTLAGVLAGLGVLLGSSVSGAQQSAAAGPRSRADALALTGVTVIDVQDGRLIPEQTVIVSGNRVQAVGPLRDVRIPAGAQVVDARGKYLVPGFWDMHAHTERPGSDDLQLQDSLYRAVYPLYIAHGVTGLREMAQRFPDGADSFRVWQRQVMDGKRVGPRAVGPSADLSYNMDLGSPERIGRIMDSLKAAGMAFVKYHGETDAEVFFAVLREARRVGLPVAGHVSRAASNVDASDSGLASVEHIEENHECWPDWPSPLDSVDAQQRCTPVAKAYIKNGTWMCVTLSGAHWLDHNLPDALAFVRMMHRLGVRKFLTGTDESPFFPKPLPGVSVLEEIAFLGAAGLTPLEALQAATLNPAKYFNATDSLGTIAAGKLADLVLLDADPLVDLRNVLRIRAVIANGRYFDRSALDAMDPVGDKSVKEYLDRPTWPADAASAGPE